ncbi:hypothetical protein [Peribacillus simplex]|uniref:hypothetical protein n=1 Tax=Peribacillus simplex TaxID=1478 RepID=UPI0037C87933
MEEEGILYILLNPINSYQAKKTSLRKVKTDAIDAYQLCVLTKRILNLIKLEEFSY